MHANNEALLSSKHSAQITSKGHFPQLSTNCFIVSARAHIACRHATALVLANNFKSTFIASLSLGQVLLIALRGRGGPAMDLRLETGCEVTELSER